MPQQKRTAQKASAPAKANEPLGATYSPPVTQAAARAAEVAERSRLVSNGTGGYILPPDQHFDTT